jgi:hypothetical protein
MRLSPLAMKYPHVQRESSHLEPVAEGGLVYEEMRVFPLLDELITGHCVAGEDQFVTG